MYSCKKRYRTSLGEGGWGVLVKIQIKTMVYEKKTNMSAVGQMKEMNV